MAILAFQKPDKVIMLEGTDTVGRFEFRPLEPGYGQTIGNALRRILLASLEGFAISQIKISGVDQEFATIPGVIEGMQDIILNLKQVRLKRMVDTQDSEVATIVISGKNEFTAEAISKGLSSFKVLNPEQHICSLEPSVTLEITLTITKGRGFVPAEEMRSSETPIGTIPIDAVYTPIKKVNWSVENWRVEQKTDYEKLNLEIVTDGSISPNMALQEAANILIYHFKLFTDDKNISIENAVESDTKELDEESLRTRHLLLTKLSDIGLSVRAFNCLKAAEIETFADLVSYSRNELMKFRNFGKKSLNEIDEVVEKMKLQFGMDVRKYNIEPKKKNV
ncbi:MAG: DNA-directed RNA polymerase subunit alpha [Bacteroidales bacterium]|uniref:DNA-directed RNA polymerase subunit alpha n=1 Tax=Candidatus Cryptobacteroides sp. TaxID=2952915 RepID=UPI002A742FAD|nr:DNA-directed RNA polymerase subunit alpha [Candidatus Cryptobacteroides sp.]MBS7277849.1 DNA-directed RNA polymerase subunit alpha [Bacteroidales bacterium]MCI6527256.1 DNA-directed RNA polymerase subunit alpha [Bacteroidales bacterium]MDD5914829.1 DNA-directed RNA polymerase subunit alpha [Bacteroidales bacterium]MDD6829893.1 DNA-directed RNA polymerase subunit alpha [Bacteroidales bacterium]MDD7135409.1 DNA-directed RNA polymerase subunit alpha [Bacteroidales bacterium]